MRFRYVSAIFSLEIRKTLSYRVDFWMHFLGSVFIGLLIAFFLWKAIFDYNQAQTMGGFSFHALMLYYLLIPMTLNIIMPSGSHWIGFISKEIYEGTLNRYLVYPVSFLNYKIISHFSESFIAVIQLVITFSLYLIIFDLPSDYQISLNGTLLATVSVLFSILMYFHLGACIEMIAFWADNIWSLMVMLRFMITMLGGVFIPLSFFPESFQNVLNTLPFPYLVYFPVQTFLGKVSFEIWLNGIAITLFWGVFFFALSKVMWKMGTKKYTGVGI